MLSWLYIWFFGGILCFSSPQPILKIAYAGSYIIVPEHKTWKIERAFISEGGMYNIMINTSHFRSSYNAGDTIRFPFYIAEMELLSEGTMVQYQLHIDEQ